jgi:hypothetical protein
MTRWKKIALLLLLGTSLAGCKGVDTDAEKARVEAAEKAAMVVEEKALAEYLASSKPVSLKLHELGETLERVWADCQEDCDIVAHKKAFEDQVLPAFRSFLTALESMPTGSERLALVHEPIVRAYRESGELLGKYPDGLTEENTAPRRIAYLNELDLRIKVVEKEYDVALSAYCKSVPNVSCDVSLAADTP